MLKIVFHLGTTAYSVSVDKVKEILPFVPVTLLSGAPEFVAGVLHYRGDTVPVIDLCRLITGQPAANCFSTRIMILKAPNKNGRRLLGLIAEGVTDTIQDYNDAAPGDIETVLPSSMYDFLLNSAAQSS